MPHNLYSGDQIYGQIEYMMVSPLVESVRICGQFLKDKTMDQGREKVLVRGCENFHPALA